LEYAAKLGVDRCVRCDRPLAGLQAIDFCRGCGLPVGEARQLHVGLAEGDARWQSRLILGTVTAAVAAMLLPPGLAVGGWMLRPLFDDGGSPAE
jgi:hypothetical protein